MMMRRQPNAKINFWLFSLVAVAMLSLLAWQLAANPAHEERGIAQERLDLAGAALAPGYAAAQTFYSERAGLCALEFLLVRYRPDDPLPADARVLLTLERLDIHGPALEVELNPAGWQHNQTIRFSFDPQPDSAHATYRATLTCDQPTDLAFWRTASDAYSGGAAFDGDAEQPGDLYFRTFYRYRLADALAELAAMAARGLRLLPALLIALALPGWVLALYLLPNATDSPGTRGALIVALSIAFWPILFLWAAVFGISLAGGRVWIVVGLLLAAAGWRVWGRGRRPALCALPRRDPFPEIALALILALTVATRMIQARDLAAPAWVDSVHHTMVTQLIVEQGHTPASAEPYLPARDFHYHYGFHAVAAVFVWLSELESYRAVLIVGQALNALAALGAYALGAWAGRSRWAGVGAALVAGLVSIMPAYFVSWGRYTQLAGLVVLPAACIALDRALQPRRGARREWMVAGALAAGMALTHYRVAIFYALWWAAVMAVCVLRWVEAKQWRPGAPISYRLHANRISALLAVASCAGLLILPWLARFALRIIPQVSGLYGGWVASEGLDNAFPAGLLNVGHTRSLIYVAAAGAIWGLARLQGRIVLLAAWVGLWFVAANPRWLGLPDLWLLQNAQVVISLWLPIGALAGWLLADLVGWLARAVAWLFRRRQAMLTVSAALTVALIGVGGWGAWNMVDVINPITVLVTADDLAALRWAARNTPPDAYFLVNARHWQSDLWVGSDAGWWLPYVAGRRATMPCALYNQVSPDYREAINDLARAVEQAKSLDDPALIERLRAEGVTHVFVGERAGPLLPKDLDASSHYRLLYSHGPARVYAFAP